MVLETLDDLEIGSYIFANKKFRYKPTRIGLVVMQ